MISYLSVLKKTNHDYIDDNGVSWDTKFNYLSINILGLCGCGNPYDITEYILKYLLRLSDKRWGEYEDLNYMFFCYWANKMDFAEHGTSIRCSCLTEKGEQLIKDIHECLNDYVEGL